MNWRAAAVLVCAAVPVRASVPGLRGSLATPASPISSTGLTGP